VLTGACEFGHGVGGFTINFFFFKIKIKFKYVAAAPKKGPAFVPLKLLEYTTRPNQQDDGAMHGV
jgi:hypothetical protein